MIYSGLIYLFVFSFGACIGSFLNVVIYRLPAKLSLIYPPSRCPKCLHPLGKMENIPVFGWLWLRGKCRWCHTRVSPRYPIIEAITGVLFMLVYQQFGLSWWSLGYMAFVSWLIPLAMIDVDTMTLPNPLTQSGLVLGLLWQCYVGFLDNGIQGASLSLFFSIVGGVIGIWLFDFILIFGTIILGKPAMGGGDPKLAGMMGVWLGWQGILLTAFLASAFGTLFGISAIYLKLMDKDNHIPFGPYLVLGAITTLFFGEKIISAYLLYMGLG